MKAWGTINRGTKCGLGMLILLLNLAQPRPASADLYSPSKRKGLISAVQELQSDVSRRASTVMDRLARAMEEVDGDQAAGGGRDGQQKTAGQIYRLEEEQQTLEAEQERFWRDSYGWMQRAQRIQGLEAQVLRLLGQLSREERARHRFQAELQYWRLEVERELTRVDDSRSERARRLLLAKQNRLRARIQTLQMPTTAQAASPEDTLQHLWERQMAVMEIRNSLEGRLAIAQLALQQGDSDAFADALAGIILPLAPPMKPHSGLQPPSRRMGWLVGLQRSQYIRWLPWTEALRSDPDTALALLRQYQGELLSLVED